MTELSRLNDRQHLHNFIMNQTDVATIVEDPYKSVNFALVFVWVFRPGVILTQGPFPSVL